MGLLMLSTALDYAYGFWVASPNRKKAKLFLWLSIINNLGILAVFKYYNFFAVQIQFGLEQLGLHTNPVLLQLALPIGISFYTFHGMSYVIDIYRGQQKPVKKFVDYAVFVSFFPLLVAGPIERANHLLPQVLRPRRFDYTQAVDGCRLMIWGFFKKVVIADSLAPIVNDIFANYNTQDSSTLILGMIYFSFQIYGDFSGYSDIALGTAKLFGFELLSNFKFPYFSRDVAEFWRRWHISLSSWFRDYLYIPLGGSKNGKYKAVRNTFIIFLVSGFWHGASWNFIAWGFIHACAFLPLLLLNRNRNFITDVVAQETLLPTFKEFTQMLITFAFVSFAWLFFRISSIESALEILHKIVIGISHFSVPSFKSFLIYPIILILLDWINRKQYRTYHFGPPKFELYFIFPIMILTLIYHSTNQSEFIYFAF